MKIFGFVAVSQQRLQISEVSWVLRLVFLCQSSMLPVVVLRGHSCGDRARPKSFRVVFALRGRGGMT